MLHVDGLSKSFGGVPAVRDVTLTITHGETRAIIGPNGAGKSTLFNLITGHLPPDAGTVTLDTTRLDRLPPHRRAARGIAIVFQAARIFRHMTVRENVMVGAHLRTRAGFLPAALRLPAHFRAERDIRAHAEEALDRVGLTPWADADAASLPLGQQRAMQVARAVCAQPRLLLLDEPASGLRAPERDHLARVIEDLKDTGVTTMLVEHDVAFVSRLADQVTVIDLGQVIAQGTPREIRADPKVVNAYLGAEGSPTP
ncbi:ABC transporter ATP-binding protein [Spiractinospora alimapuensis]|uniref:ABC transporter ATP-binding protein n=1 Tax=Spiractinospora alimapuensis TaxID=2820884 RepID=UPI001F308266|nr:ABC transporter ATP-binding protein [Spiractinospora alimapuensis]QVQ52853.1 ABC transporter ATP-binding protein [Spiractinospora alimapuensis]